MLLPKHLKRRGLMDVITFVYSVWWTSLLAMLKGYVDKVFSYGFAYEYVDGVPNGLLKGKKGLF